MATPVIAAVSEQDITIDTDYELEIGITNDPEEVTVDGLLEGFYYSWDADSDTLTITGEATRLLGDAMWIVSAKETTTSTAVTSEITYNVVPTAPIIEEIGEQTVFKGQDTDIFVEIQNSPTQIGVDGLLTGLKFESGSEGEGEDAVNGVRIQGLLPLSTNLTVDSTNFNIVTSNDGGEDVYNLPVSLQADPYQNFMQMPRGIVDPSYPSSFFASGITWTGSEFLIFDSFPGSKVHRINADGMYLGSWDIHADQDRGHGIVWTGTEVLIVDDSRTVFRYESDGTYLGSWATHSDNGDPTGIGWTGTEVLICSNSVERWGRYESDGTFLGVRFLDDTNLNARGIVWVNGEVFVVDITNVSVFRYMEDGTLISEWDLEAVVTTNFAVGITWDGASLVVLNQDGTFVKYGLDGTSQAGWATFTGIVGGITWTGSEVLIGDSDDDEIYRYQIDGTSIGSWSVTTPIQAPAFEGKIGGLTWIDGELHILGANARQAGNNYVYKFTNTGTYIDRWETNYTQAFQGGIAWTGTEIITVNHNLNQIVRYMPDGTHIGNWDLHADNDDASGVVVTPTGEILVANRGTNNKVFRYNATDGSYLGQWNLLTQNDGAKGITWTGSQILVPDTNDYLYIYQ